MTYQYLKVIHILGVVLFFGAGLASATTKMRADLTGDPRTIAFALRQIVWADWLFTVPSAVILPVTGLWMAHLLGIPWTRGWVGAGLSLYVFAGVCWLPAVFLQLKMKGAAEIALRDDTPLSEDYHRWTRWWLVLGAPAFVASVGAIYIMVTKQVSFVG